MTSSPLSESAVDEAARVDTPLPKLLSGEIKLATAEEGADREETI